MNINTANQDIFIKMNIEDFLMELPLPTFMVSKERGIYRSNLALARLFEYDSVQIVNQLLAENRFFLKHFTQEILTETHSNLLEKKMLKEWPITGQCCGGRVLKLQMTAWANWPNCEEIPDNFLAIFTPGGLGDHNSQSQDLPQKIREEAEMVGKAKNEFLANISHELRTPLHIVCGMVNMVMEDETMGDEMRGNLGMAKNAAESLLNIVNDIITMASLEAGKIVSDVVPFSPETLLTNLKYQFTNQAQAKGITITTASQACANTLVEGGHNLISMAMEKLINNAIKFNDKEHGEIILKCIVLEENGVFCLDCAVLDNGPGLDESFIRSQELFCQGDGSMVRKHGGLGLGLRLAARLATVLGGNLILGNTLEGGAEVGICVPVTLSSME